MIKHNIIILECDPLYKILIEIVKEEKIINEDEVKKLEKWRDDPNNWM